MARAKLTTKGFDDWLERIADAGADIDEVVAEALFSGAEVMQDAMRAEAPVRDPSVPAKEPVGNLKAHIKIKGPDREGNFHIIEIGVIHDKRFTDANTARYGMAQEYGWLGNPGKSYMRSGRDKSRRRARAAMQKVFEARYPG